MPTKKHLVVVGNYPPDKQASMALFADWIAEGLRDKGWDVDILKPPARLAKNSTSTLSGVGKWLGYIDKFILFPRQLKRFLRSNPNARFLVADHSNAYYAKFLPRDKTVVTCHDVLAIEGALGDPEAFCPASKTGVFFQKWILSSLKDAPSLAFVSKHTEMSYLKLPGQEHPEQQRTVIPNGINQPLQKLNQPIIEERLKTLDPTLFESPYILHVGSSLPRKNREAVMKAFAEWAALNPGEERKLVFVGKPLSTTEQKAADELKITSNLNVYSGVSSETLEAAYNGAFAFCFPSFSEGFGWPIIEAQSCGTPAIVGNRSCLPEVAGENAILCDPYQPETITTQLKLLENIQNREASIQHGFDNINRFTPDATIGAYARLFDNLTTA